MTRNTATSMQLEAFCALIDRRLSDDPSLIGSAAADRLARELVASGDAKFLRPNDYHPAAETFALLGIVSHATSGTRYALLSDWQSRARRKIKALRTAPPKTTAKVNS